MEDCNQKNKKRNVQELEQNNIEQIQQKDQELENFQKERVEAFLERQREREKQEKLQQLSNQESKGNDQTQQLPAKFDLLQNTKIQANNQLKDCRFFINKLYHYPKEQYTNYMLGIEEIVYEDPFYKQKKLKTPKWTAESIFLTTFGVQNKYLMPIIESKVHFVLADHHDEKKAKIEFRNDPKYTLIYPPKDFANKWSGSFHPKLWLIKFPKFLRVCIGSGNLYDDDWEWWSNCIYYQDFEISLSNQSLIKKQKEQDQEQKQFSKEEEKTNFDLNKDFKDTLKYFIQSIMPNNQKYEEILKIDLDNYIFEGIDYVLIPSLPGRSKGEKMFKLGKCKVQKIVNQIFPPSKKYEKPVMSYICSSLGPLDQKILQEVFTCFIPGYSTFEELKKNQKNDKDFNKKIQIIYPTMKYILKESIGGIPKAGPVIFNEKYYVKDSYPKDIFFKLEAPENYAYHHGLIPHLKVFIITENDFQINDDTIIFYGSHNFTGAAWGKMELQYSQQYIMNTELGVLLPSKQGSKQIKQDLVARFPFKFPPQQIDKDDLPFVRQINY